VEGLTVSSLEAGLARGMRLAGNDLGELPTQAPVYCRGTTGARVYTESQRIAVAPAGALAKLR
jgi:hypothetical protein